MRTWIYCFFPVALLFCLLTEAKAATLLVNSSKDDITTGDGMVSLREALIAANGDKPTDLGHCGAGADRIEFQFTSATILLQQALPVITTQVEIAGPIGGSLTISGNRKVRVLQVDKGATVTLSRLVLTAGRADAGGAVYNEGTILLQNCTVSDSQCFSTRDRRGGGGLFNNGGMTLLDCQVCGNLFSPNWAGGDFGGGGLRNEWPGKLTMRRCLVANNGGPPDELDMGQDGGGLLNLGFAELEDCSIRDNHCKGCGGGIYSDTQLTLTRCSIHANHANNDGGGIDAEELYSSSTLINCSVTANTANFTGGISSEGNVALINSTISYNERTHPYYYWMPGGLRVSKLMIGNTIIACNIANSDTPDYIYSSYWPADLGHNFLGIGDPVDYGNPPKDGVNGNIVGTKAQPADPLLGDYQMSAAGLVYLPLLPGSKAVDAGTNKLVAAPYFPSTPGLDIQGKPRITDGNSDRMATVDIGAFEYEWYAASFAWRLYH